MSKIAELIDRVAQLSVAGIPDVDIAKATGITDEQLAKLRESAEYKAIHAAKFDDAIDTQLTVNDGWDEVEMLALSNLRQVVGVTQDPDINIKIAAVANKANRRGKKRDNVPLDGRAGTTAVVNLTATFVERLQQNTVVQTDGQAAQEALTLVDKKGQDFMPPRRLEEIFGISAPKEEGDQNIAIEGDLAEALRNA